MHHKLSTWRPAKKCLGTYNNRLRMAMLVFRQIQCLTRITNTHSSVHGHRIFFVLVSDKFIVNMHLFSTRTTEILVKNIIIPYSLLGWVHDRVSPIDDKLAEVPMPIQWVHLRAIVIWQDPRATQKVGTGEVSRHCPLYHSERDGVHFISLRPVEELVVPECFICFLLFLLPHWVYNQWRQSLQVFPLLQYWWPWWPTACIMIIIKVIIRLSSPPPSSSK